MFTSFCFVDVEIIKRLKPLTFLPICCNSQGWGTSNRTIDELLLLNNKRVTDKNYWRDNLWCTPQNLLKLHPWLLLVKKEKGQRTFSVEHLRHHHPPNRLKLRPSLWCRPLIWFSWCGICVAWYVWCVVFMVCDGVNIREAEYQSHNWMAQRCHIAFPMV